jgi:hypothetical protein
MAILELLHVHISTSLDVAELAKLDGCSKHLLSPDAKASFRRDLACRGLHRDGEICRLLLQRGLPLTYFKPQVPWQSDVECCRLDLGPDCSSFDERASKIWREALRNNDSVLIYALSEHRYPTLPRGETAVLAKIVGIIKDERSPHKTGLDHRLRDSALIMTALVILDPIHFLPLASTRIVVKIVQMYGFFRYAAMRHRDDVEIVMAAVRLDYRALQHASSRLQDSAEVVQAAVQERASALEYASARLRDDYDLVVSVVRHDGRALRFASDRLRGDRDVVLVAVLQQSEALEYASVHLRDDSELVLSAVSGNGYALRFASDRLRNDHDVVLEALRHDAKALQHASAERRNDRVLVLRMLAEISQSGLALRYTSAELRSDRDVVLAAVRRNGTALDHACQIFLRDREVVLEAVRGDSHGRALQLASAEFHADREIVRHAARGGMLFSLQHVASGHLSVSRVVLAEAILGTLERHPWFFAANRASETAALEEALEALLLAAEVEHEPPRATAGQEFRIAAFLFLFHPGRLMDTLELVREATERELAALKGGMPVTCNGDLLDRLRDEVRRLSGLISDTNIEGVFFRLSNSPNLKLLRERLLAHAP